jgi:hypothetical protein
MTQAKFIGSVPLWTRTVLVKETPTVSGRGFLVLELLPHFLCDILHFL